MAVSFKIPASPQRSIFNLNEFLGVDFTNSGVNMDERRSPNAPNMVRNVPAKVRKRMGYELRHEFASHKPIYGTHLLKLNDTEIDTVTNTNRALNTSTTYQPFSLSADNTLLYTFGTPFFPNQKICYEFDYTLTEGLAVVEIGDITVELEPMVDGHIKGSTDFLPLSDTTLCTACYARISPDDPESSLLLLQIKNFSIMYETDSEYSYSPAPEDNGGTFSIANVISVGEQNFGSPLHNTDTVTVNNNKDWVDIEFAVNQDESISETPFCFLDVTASTTTTGQNSIKVVAKYADDSESTIYEGTSVNSKHFINTIPSQNNGYYLDRIVFYFSHNHGVTETFSATYTGLKLNSATPKTQYKPMQSVRLYHVGNELYSEYQGIYTLLYSNMNERRSQSWQFNSYIYIADGKNFIRYKSGDMTVTDVAKSGIGTIPTVTIGREPSGGGYPYEDRNLIQAGYEERFLADGTSANYQLSYFPLDSKAVTVKMMQNDGSFLDMNEGDDFSVNRTTGVVTFASVPPVSPLEGEDNVYITAYKTTEGSANRINNCTIGVMYGVNGDTNRLFLSGNSTYPNLDWYSEIDDPTYFADTSYSALGSETSAIMGYTRVGKYLATHKDENELSQSVFIRDGETVDEEDENGNKVTNTVFRITNTLQGAGTISRYCFGYLETEPLFLTREGIFAITSQDITGEKYGQNRSFYLNGKMLEELNLDNAFCVNFNNYYILAVNNKFYMLDGLQPVATDKSLPYATRQYTAFYCDNIPAYTLWVEEERLWFGTTDGLVFSFFTDETALESYADNGAPISAWWETPELDGKLFYKNKTFRYLAVRMMSSLSTSIKLWGKKHGIWSLLKEDTSSARYFAFSKIKFSAFSFSVDTSERLAHTKVRIKKVDKARFKLENSVVNEPFGLFDFALEYIESGNFKG